MDKRKRTDDQNIISWSHEETLTLISGFQLFEDVMFRSGPNFGNLKPAIKYLIENNLLENRTPKQVEAKWRNLVRSYRAVNDRGKRTSRFIYFTQMDEILKKYKEYFHIKNPDEDKEELLHYLQIDKFESEDLESEQLEINNTIHKSNKKQKTHQQAYEEFNIEELDFTSITEEYNNFDTDTNNVTVKHEDNSSDVDLIDNEFDNENDNDENDNNNRYQETYSSDAKEKYYQIKTKYLEFQMENEKKKLLSLNRLIEIEEKKTLILEKLLSRDSRKNNSTIPLSLTNKSSNIYNYLDSK